MNDIDELGADGNPYDIGVVDFPGVHEVVGRTTTSLGEVLILRTDNPYLSSQGLNFGTYVALADWMPNGSPVVMFVVVRNFDAGPAVGNVYAAPSVRGRSRSQGSGDSVPVQIGSWLFMKGAFTTHSADRTPSGDRWARLVGGTIPPIASGGRGPSDAADVERQAELAYRTLSEKDWARWLSPRK